MSNHHSEMSKIDNAVYKEIDDLLKSKGIIGLKVAGLKFEITSTGARRCRQGKKFRCWTNSNGRTYCRCV